MPEPREQPWYPSPADMPFMVTLLNPHGDRHLAFDDDAGRWYRLWQHRAPQPLHTGEAVLLRPSDVDGIIKFTAVWIIENPGEPRAGELVDELAAGVKQLVLHFARAAGEVPQTSS